ncbi:MAG TPA: DUF6766 family protein [Marmoricola sp.]|nr:DUF6766 family protein [Marmoricola sp.]
MRRIKNSTLSLFFLALFLLTLVGQAFAGWSHFNNEQLAGGLGTISFGRYLASADFAVDVAENWQSEYLQFLLFILATIWFVQKGSPESSALEETGLENDKEQKVGAYAQDDSPGWVRAGGWRTAVYSWSLTITMGLIFLGAWFTQSVAGWAQFNEARLGRLQDPLTWGSYVLNSDFWSRTLQNWQSEFLAVGSMAVFAIFLRQRGSSESKPVGEPHPSTGVSG